MFPLTVGKLLGGGVGQDFAPPMMRHAVSSSDTETTLFLDVYDLGLLCPPVIKCSRSINTVVYFSMCCVF